jgi:hypothetical protein
VTVPRWQRIYLVVCAAVIGYALAYTVCDYAPWPRLTYFPDRRAWELLDRPSSPVPMNYVGTVAWGIGGACVGALLGWATGAALRRELPQRWITLAGAWALTAAGMAGAYYLWNLWPF